MHYVYIIYSATIKKYYIGETKDLSLRLVWHNTKEFKASYTSKVSDWEVFFAIECVDIVQARKIEKHIKSMKSRTYIENLKKHKEISQKLLEKYS
ncbi:MAG TPA: GIY-YIG nuclease family protein [Aquaticitalea sp.]|nr:GIY-YIG nuclease family protein [Aquaticitalea sp.]HNU59277.1 GIY-YIG nuclease family protein [Aquaticitalea sp.]